MNGFKVKIQTNGAIGIPLKYNPVIGYYSCYNDILNRSIYLVPDIRGQFRLRLYYAKNGNRAIFQNLTLTDIIKSQLGSGIGDKLNVTISDKSIIGIYKE